MKKILAIVVLGLLLHGCADHSGTRPFGSKPKDAGRVLEANEHFIKIVFDRSVYGDLSYHSVGNWVIVFMVVVVWFIWSMNKD